MTITILTPTSFSVVTIEGGDKKEAVFSFPKQLTNWQLSALAALMGDVIVECYEAGTTILNVIMAVANASMDAATAGDAKAKSDAVTEALGELQRLFKGGFTADFSRGTGEILRYVGKSNVLGRASAILFLKKDETVLADATLEERALLFAGLPATTVWNGVKDFFGSKGTSTTNSPSPSATSATTTNGSSPSTSATSTTTSTGASDISTPLPMDD